jgi:diaminopimelate decarboxylase
MPQPITLSLTDLEDIIKMYGSPLYLYDYDGIVQNAKNFMSTFKKYIPDFQQYFAVKALPNIQIMKLLKENGMGFDCSSVTEIEMADMIKGNILYTSNYTSVEDISSALKYKLIINLDDIDGLYNMIEACKINKYIFPSVICFRLNPRIGKTDSGTKSNILGGVDSKFGMSMKSIIDAYKLAKYIGIKHFGIHVMTGSCIMDIDYWKELIDVLFESMNIISKEVNITFDFVNLGGGIGIPYKLDEKQVDIDTLAYLINKKIFENCEKYNMLYPKVMMECGRYITGSYGYLISKCKSIKVSDTGNTFYGLDACMSNLMRPGMYNSYHYITVPRLTDEKKYINANVVGSLCENNDWFARSRMLPSGIKKGDIFIIHDAGAHSSSMGFQYNGKLRCIELMFKVDGDKLLVKEIKKKETIEYYLQSQL